MATLTSSARPTRSLAKYRYFWKWVAHPSGGVPAAFPRPLAPPERYIRKPFASPPEAGRHLRPQGRYFPWPSALPETLTPEHPVQTLPQGSEGPTLDSGRVLSCLARGLVPPCTCEFHMLPRNMEQGDAPKGRGLAASCSRCSACSGYSLRAERSSTASPVVLRATSGELYFMEHLEHLEQAGGTGPLAFHISSEIMERPGTVCPRNLPLPM